MLVLSRQRDETIMIGDNIEITVVDIRGDKVRLGITAPNTVPVHRKEVYEAIQRENREAAKVRMEDLTALPKSSTAVPNRNPGGSADKHQQTRPGIIPVTRPGNSENGTGEKPLQNPPEQSGSTGPG